MLALGACTTVNNVLRQQEECSRAHIITATAMLVKREFVASSSHLVFWREYNLAFSNV